MRSIKFKINKIGNNKLMFLKIVKTHSGMDLRTAKDWMDTAFASIDRTHNLLIKTSIDELKKDVEEHLDGFDISFHDKERQRQIKLISLGLGDKYEKIEIIADTISGNLLLELNRRKQEATIDIIEDFFKDFLLSLNSDQLDDLINKQISESN